MSDAQRLRIRVTGTVQGVGFRPFVFGLAAELGLDGLVGNDADGVFVEVEGPQPATAEFVRRLADDAPALSVVDAVHCEAVDLRGETGFRIVASPLGVASGAATSIPPDTATCRDCLAELRNPADRRFGYPFIACTNCGPRYTMVNGLPYDRANTTMSDFPLCEACRAEYEDPSSRRFHAQPTACWECGPSLSMPVEALVAALWAGRIVAIKGVGGYHLACNAEDVAAVQRLRTRKRRGDKPFAVMTPQPARVAHLTGDDGLVLESPARPILLLPAVDARLQDRIAPGNGFVGVMLPYTPLQHLLFDAGAPPVLVMTSGNLSDEPICTDPGEAESRLAGIADDFCHHDRRITVAVDDSVARAVAGSLQPVRRSRGYAPLPVRLPVAAVPSLAVGGEIKAAVAVAEGSRAWLSQHIGDTENLQTLDMLARSVEILCRLQQVVPEVIISDAHPGYLSRRWASDQARARGVEHLTVQHHHAHLASLLAEHRLEADRPVLGVVFDGTGYGDDGTIWGGELLLGGYGGVRRVGHLRPVRLPGGDAAIKFPARSALAHLAAAGLPESSASREQLDDGEAGLLHSMLRSGSHCVPTTSMGRLFDAVASLLDVRHRIDYEAQAAIELEALAATAAAGPAWACEVRDEDGTVVIDPGVWLSSAVADRQRGVPAAESARAFHAGLALAVAQAAHLVRQRYGVTTVGLSGGVFANGLLTVDCLRELGGAGFTVLTHRVVPPNDGGLALGQVAVVAAGGGQIAGMGVR